MEALFVPIIAALATLLTVKMNSSKADESDSQMQASANELGLTEEEAKIRRRRIERIRSYAMRADWSPDKNLHVWGVIVSFATASIFILLFVLERIIKDGYSPYGILAATGTVYFVVFLVADPLISRISRRRSRKRKKRNRRDKDDESDEEKDV